MRGDNNIALGVGKWFISVFATFQTNTSTRAYGGVTLSKNGSSVVEAYQQCEAQYSWGNVHVSCIMDVSTSDTIIANLTGNNANVIFTNYPDKRCVANAFRIG